MDPLTSLLLSYPIGVATSFTYEGMKSGYNKLKDHFKSEDIDGLKKLFIKSFFKALDFHEKTHDDYSSKIINKLRKNIEKDKSNLFFIFTKLADNNSGDIFSLMSKKNFRKKLAEEIVRDYEFDFRDDEELILNIIVSCLNYYQKAFFDEMNNKEATQLLLKQLLDTKEIIKTHQEEVSQKLDHTEQVLSGKVDKLLLENNDSQIKYILNEEHKAQLKNIQKLLKSYKQKEALNQLNIFKNRVWDECKDSVKYQILKSEGFAKLKLEYFEKAGKKLIEAFQYDQDNEKAICNRALGHLILGQIEDAILFANKALEKNPTNEQAYSIIIQSSKDSEKLKDIISKVPKSYRNTAEVSYAIGVVAARKEKFNESEKWLKIANEKTNDESPEIKGLIGGIILRQVMENNLFGFENNKKEKLEEALEMLNESWDYIFNTDLREIYVEWIINRSTVKKLLNDLDGTIEDINVALEIDPDNPQFIQRRAILAYENNNFYKAIKLLNSILGDIKTPETPILLSQAIVAEDDSESKIREAVDILNQFKKENNSDKLKQEANRFLIRLYIDLNQISESQKIVNSTNYVIYPEISKFLDKALILKNKNKIKDALLLLKKAKKNITFHIPSHYIIEIADLLFELNQFQEAAELYELVSDINLDEPSTRKLLDSYYNEGKLKNSLNICKGLRGKYGCLRNVTEMEVTIYEEINDLEQAKELCEEYLISFPNVLNAKLRYSIINYRLGNFEKVNEFLDSISVNDIHEMSLEFVKRIVRLYISNERYKTALKFMYEIKRKYTNDNLNHENYMVLLFTNNNLNIQDYNQVEIDTAVCIEDDNNNKHWYIIEDREDSDIEKGEINLNHKLADKLLGKAIGNEIVLKDVFGKKEYAEIIEIKSKYLYALKESDSLFERGLLEYKNIQKFEIDTENPVADLQNKFESRTKELKEIKKLYKNHQLTIGSFANMMGKNIINLWHEIINDIINIKINCFRNKIIDIDYESFLLKEDRYVVIDIISLLTLDYLNIKDDIIDFFGKLGIAQSSIDIIQGNLLQSKKFGNKIYIEKLESLLKWVRNNCDVIPCKKALNINRGKREELEKILGKTFTETILIAGQPGNILYSEDIKLIGIAKNHIVDNEKINTKEICTQHLLIHFLKKDLIEREKYNKKMIKLACSNYNVVIDADILMGIIKKKGLSLSSPYASVLKFFNGKNSNLKYALKVTRDFLFLFSQCVILPAQYDIAVQLLLKALIKNRNSYLVLNKLLLQIKLLLKQSKKDNINFEYENLSFLVLNLKKNIGQILLDKNIGCKYLNDQLALYIKYTSQNNIM